jgi:hypothetical protein
MRAQLRAHAGAFGQVTGDPVLGVVAAVSRWLPNHHWQYVYEGSSEEKGDPVRVA